MHERLYASCSTFLDYWGLGDKETVPLPQRTTWGKSLVCQGCGNMIRGVSKRPPVKTPMEPVGCELEISYLLTQGNEIGYWTTGESDEIES